MAIISLFYSPSFEEFQIVSQKICELFLTEAEVKFF